MVSKRVLLDCEIFSGLSDSELDAVAKLCVSQEFGAGTTLFEEGASATHFYVVEEGKVALEMNIPTGLKDPRKRVAVDIVTRGEPMAWSSLAEPYVFTLSAVCLDRVRVTTINAAQLRDLLQRDPSVGYKVMKGLVGVVSSRLQHTRHVLASERGLGAPV